MKTVAIISDTHGLLRTEVIQHIKGVDAIVHAGDINTQAIVDKLQSYAPLYIVRGNNDKAWAEGLSHHLNFSIDNVRFYLVHNKKDVPADIHNIDVIVYGHSHKYSLERSGGILWLKPGSCGRRRFDQEITMCKMTVDDGRYAVEKISLSNT